MNLIEKLKIYNTEKKISTLSSYLPKRGKLLDFGCGDLLLSRAIKKMYSKIDLTGVDVVDFGIRPNNIRVVLYDGEKLPFKKNEFDTVIAYHVFHHCPKPNWALEECIRVAKKKLFLWSLYIVFTLRFH